MRGLFRAIFRPSTGLAVLAGILIFTGAVLLVWWHNGVWTRGGVPTPTGEPVLLGPVLNGPISAGPIGGPPGPEGLPDLPGYRLVKLPVAQLQNGWAEAATKDGWICRKEPTPPEIVDCLVPVAPAPATQNAFVPPVPPPQPPPPEKFFGLTMEELTLLVGSITMVAGVLSGLGAVGWRIFREEKLDSTIKRLERAAEKEKGGGGTAEQSGDAVAADTPPPTDAVDARITPRQEIAPEPAAAQNTAPQPAGRGDAR